VKKGNYPVVIAPYISEQGQKVCKEAGIGYIDLLSYPAGGREQV